MNKIIRVHNDLILAHSKHSVMSLRLLFYVLSSIDWSADRPDLKVQISTSEFLKVTGLCRDDRANVREAINLFDAGAGFGFKVGARDRIYPFLGVRQEDGGWLVRVNPELVPFLHRLEEQFTQVRVTQLYALRTRRAQQLFLLYCYVRHRQVRSLSVDVIRRVLDLEGSNYSPSKNFWPALKRAREEVERLTKHNEFGLEPIKEGGRLVAVNFKPYDHAPVTRMTAPRRRPKGT